MSGRLARHHLPGVIVAAILTLLALAGHHSVGVVSPLVWAMLLALGIGRWVRRAPSLQPGVDLVAGPILKVGVAMLGIQVSVDELRETGWQALLAVAVAMPTTLWVARVLGRRLGVARDLSSLIGIGTAVCGASAIAAASSTIKAREEDIGYAVATVTLFGSVTMMLIAPGALALGMTEIEAGVWAGASVHEVGQVAVAGTAISIAGLKVATVVKLVRVGCLAPLVAVMSLRRTGGASRPRTPAFLIAFVVLIAIRSLANVPPGVLEACELAAAACITAGMAALALRIRLFSLRTAGPRPALLGLAASITVVACPLLPIALVA